MRVACFLSCVAFLTLTTAVAQAQSNDSARLAGAIAPLVDDQTLFVVHVDLEAVDTAAGVAKLADLFQLPPDMKAVLASAAARIGREVKTLRESGARELFMLVNVADIPSQPLTMVVPISPTEKMADVMKIQEVLSNFALPGGKPVSMITAEYVAVGSKGTFDRASSQANATSKGPKSKGRPEIAEAFKAVETSAVQLLFVPSAQTRRVLEEMMPTLPAVAGGGPTKPFTSGLRWVAIGATIPPKPIAIKAVAQSVDAQGATTLAQEFARLITSLGNHPIVTEEIPKFDELARSLVPTVSKDQLVLEWTESNGGLKGVLAILVPTFNDMRASASSARSVNNLKVLGLAMHNYYAAHKSFPPRAILSKEGKPLLSWRVALLPYLEGNEDSNLYKEFHLDEPWDSEHNRQLIDRMPETLRSPSSQAAAGRTTYLAPVMPGAIFGGTEGLQTKQIIDGLGNTIMLVEADDDHAVVWTKPEDIEIDQENPSKGLLTGPQKAVLSLFADGSVHRLTTPEELAAARLKALLTYDGKEP